MAHSILPRLFFFFKDTATTEIYTLSLHDALPISFESFFSAAPRASGCRVVSAANRSARSEEHTSDLQSRLQLVCRLLLEKKKMAGVADCGHRRSGVHVDLDLAGAGA